MLNTFATQSTILLLPPHSGAQLFIQKTALFKQTLECNPPYSVFFFFLSFTLSPRACYVTTPLGGAPVERVLRFAPKIKTRPARDPDCPFTLMFRKLPACLPAAFDSPTCLSHSSSESESRRRQSFTFLLLSSSSLVVTASSALPLARRKTAFSVTCFALTSSTGQDKTTFGHRVFLSHLSNDKLHFASSSAFCVVVVLVTFLQSCTSFLSPPSDGVFARECEVMFPSRSDAHDIFVCCFVLCVAKMLMMFAEDTVDRSRRLFFFVFLSSFLHLVLFVHLRAHTYTNSRPLVLLLSLFPP